MATSAEIANRGAAAAAIARTGTARHGRGGLRRALTGLAVGLPLLALAGLAAYGTGYAYRPATAVAAAPPAVDLPTDPKALKRLAAQLVLRQKQLLAAIDKKKPRGTYLVIDQTQNRLYVMKDEEVQREVVCSAGSGMILQEDAGKQRKWVFDTPRGVFKVLQRVENPVWKKPDWAFVEEGKPIPRNDSERFDYGVLGEYALHFGNGYMIHGTLYERLLGRSVTHGCIRLGRDDLREVWRVAEIGTPIYIY